MSRMSRMTDEALLKRGCRCLFMIGLFGVVYGHLYHDWMAWATGALTFYLLITYKGGMVTITKTVVIEYSPSQKRVVVRGVWPDDAPVLKPLEEGNQQNYVKCFEGIDHKAHVGFTGLSPTDDKHT